MSGQLITVRMNRGDASSPWGFRLQGGKDWGTPLAVSKINPGSLAEQGGLQVGDFIIKIGSSSGQEMLHHEAQEAIKSAKNNLDLQIQRGGTLTWRPTVTAVGDLPKPGTINSTPNSTQPATFTKTSLAKTGPEPRPIGTGHNSAAKPFGGVGIGGGGNSRLPALVHKQFNSPLNLYSESNIKETLQAHTEQLAPGVMGINFMKPDAPVNKHSAVYQAILEEEQSKQKGQAAQHLANSTGQSNLEPVTVRPGAAIPKDANIIGIGGGGIPQNVSPTPGKISSPRITIPSPTQPSSIIDRPTSPSVLGAVPWHQQSPGSIHHVEAPQSPRLLQTTTPMMNQINSVPAPPVAPKPQYKPMGSQSPNLYQSHPHPYSAPSQDVHKDVSGGSKFTWPPPKPVTPVGTPEVPPTSMSNQLPGPMMTPSMVPQPATGPPTFRPVPPPGSQRPLSTYEPVKISTPNASNYR